MLLSRASAIAFLTLSISAVAIATPKPWFSQPLAQNPNPPANRSNEEVPKWIQKVNLTPAQSQRMQAISNNYRGKISESTTALRQAQLELGQMLAGDASVDSLRQKHQQVETLKQRVANLRFESLLEMREVLTPEQRRQVAENLQNRIRMRNNRPPRGSKMLPPQR
jgi:Spy/CpxP family protein refolding chaperone